MLHAFEELKIPRVISLIHPNNHGSVKVAKKLGETFEREMDFNGRKILVYGRDNPNLNALNCEASLGDNKKLPMRSSCGKDSNPRDLFRSVDLF
jgi:hypothetical protein